MGVFPGEYGDPVETVNDLDANDSTPWVVDGVLKPVTLGATRGLSYTAANTVTAYTATRTGIHEDFLLTVTANTAITLAGGSVANEVSIWNVILKQDSTGGWTITVSGVTWVGGTPTFNTTANASNHCAFVQHGTGTIYGYYGGSATS